MDKIFGEASFIEHFSSNYWIIQVFVVVLAVVFLNFIIRRALTKLKSKLKSTKTVWDDSLIEAIQKPVAMLIWIVGITFAIQIMQQNTDAYIFQAIGPIRDVGVIACITWFLIGFVKRAEINLVSKKISAGEEIDRTLVDAVGKLIRLSLIITAALVTLQTLGFSVSGVMAFGGIGGVAVGFASKDLLSNFFGGLMIYLDRPFAIGDWIRSPDRDIEGIVEKIGWRLTIIRTFDKRPLYVPNSAFATISVENPSRMTNRRIYETIGIRYDDISVMGDIVEKVRSMLVSHPDIDPSATLIVNFNAFSASSVDFFIYTFTRTTDWIEFHNIKQDVLLKISAIIEDHHAEIAFPTTTMHVPDVIKLAEKNQA